MIDPIVRAGTCSQISKDKNNLYILVVRAIIWFPIYVNLS